MIASKDRTYCIRSVLRRPVVVTQAKTGEGLSYSNMHGVTVTKDSGGIQISVSGRVLWVNDGEACEVLLALIRMLSP